MSDKLIAKCIKEGGKKGMDLLGIQETGGTAFFTCNFVEPKGDLEMLKHVLAGANKEIDPEEEERKGGAGELGKAMITHNDNQVAVIVHVPAAVADKVDLTEWVNIFAAPYKNAVVEEIDAHTRSILIKQDAEVGTFVVKVKDEVINNSFGFLRNKGLIPPPSDDDDDIGLYTEDIEW